MPTQIAYNVLSEISCMLSVIFGPLSSWDQIDFDGFEDIIEAFCKQGVRNPCVSLGGYLQVPFF